jgi:transcriptional antiterminator NusG
MNDEVMNEEIDDRGQWFVVQTLSGHENKVCESVKRLITESDDSVIYEAAIPQEILSEVKNGQRVTRKHNVFPGYIFVRMDLYNEDGTVNESAWYSVRNVQSVIGFLGGTNHPAPLSKQEIVSIFRNNNTNEQEAKPKISFEIGETVRIINGAFESFEGTITDIDIERQKLKLNVSIFGRSTPVELEFWQVERTV